MRTCITMGIGWVGLGQELAMHGETFEGTVELDLHFLFFFWGIKLEYELGASLSIPAWNVESRGLIYILSTLSILSG